jgi:hypothetical protein
MVFPEGCQFLNARCFRTYAGKIQDLFTKCMLYAENIVVCPAGLTVGEQVEKEFFAPL